MGKDKQEEICFKNLLSNKFGKYVNNKLAFLKDAAIDESWEESPDFLLVYNGKAVGIEHFLIDQTYIEQRSGCRVVDEKTWKIYEIHHKALEDGTFDSNEAAADVEGVMQDTFDVATLFDYEICMNQFDRIFDNHVKKIPRYLDNLSRFKEKSLFFLIEVSSLFINNRSKAIPCVARRKDGAPVLIGGNHIVFTTRMIEKIKTQIGVLQGIILQNYSFFDFNNEIKDMVYLDMSSTENFEESLKVQKIQVYTEYYVDAPKIKTKLNLVK